MVTTRRCSRSKQLYGPSLNRISIGRCAKRDKRRRAQRQQVTTGAESIQHDCGRYTKASHQGVDLCTSIARHAGTFINQQIDGFIERRVGKVCCRTDACNNFQHAGSRMVTLERRRKLAADKRDTNRRSAGNTGDTFRSRHVFCFLRQLLKAQTSNIARRQAGIDKPLDQQQSLNIGLCIDTLTTFGAPRHNRVVSNLPLSQGVWRQTCQARNGAYFQATIAM